MNLTTMAFEDLSHALRVLLEADLRANRHGLMQTDRAEAVGNIENGLASVLNAFHSLYDVTEKELSSSAVDWYATPELATILALRNARHHNLARKVRTLYTFHLQESKNPGRLSQYVLVDFPAAEQEADTFDVYLSWTDLDQLLSMPKAKNRLRPEVCISVRKYLAAEKFASYANYYNQPVSRVFFNFVPLVCNAAIKIVPHLQGIVAPQSLESDLYLSLFSDMQPGDIKNHEVNCGPFALVK